MKENRGMCVEYKRSLRSALTSKLNKGNLVKIVNTYAATVMSCTEDMVKWTKKQLESSSRMTRKQLTLYKYLHSKSDADMVYVYRKTEYWLVSIQYAVRQE